MTVLRFSADLDWTSRVYVGRRNPRVPDDVAGSDGRFANPYRVEGTSSEARFAAIEAFATWVFGASGAARRLRHSLAELEGKDLVCWCRPQRCHAEVLELLATGADPARIARFISELRADLVRPTLFDAKQAPTTIERAPRVS